jgi:hypothetical protein
LNHNHNGSISRKQPRTNWLFIVLVLGLIIAFTFMLTDYFKQQRIQDSLRRQIDEGTQELISLPLPSPDLQRQLEEAKNANQATRASISADTINSTNIIDALLNTAEVCDLRSDNLSTEKWSSKSIGDSSYRLMPIDLNLKGTISNLVTFIEKLENNPTFPSLVIENLSIADSGEANMRTAGLNSSPEVTAKLTAMIVTRTESATEGY